MSVTDFYIVDVSHHQGLMNFQTAKEANAQAAILRAGSVDNTTGVCYTDYQWERNKVEGPAVLPCGCYWYFRPNHSPEAQADYLAGLMESIDLKMGAWVDVEQNGGMYPAAVRLKVLAFIGRLMMYTARPGIYTRGIWWNSNVAREAAFRQSRLWVARYNAAIPGPWSDADKYRPADWNDWKLWQYSADNNNLGHLFGAQSDDIDLSRYNGTLDEFRQEFGITDEPTLEERLADLEERVSILEGIIVP